MPKPRMYPWKRPRGWWLKNPRYLLFQVREVGGVVAGVYGLVLLWQLRRFRGGETAFASLQEVLSTPPVLAITTVLFALVLVHAVTWFEAFAKSQPGRRSRPLPWQRAFAGLLGLWGVVSVVVLFLFLGGI